MGLSGIISPNPARGLARVVGANRGWIARRSLFGKYGFAHWINFGQYEGRDDGQ